MKAGAARVDITPPTGTHLAGSVGAHRPAEAVLDPLFAKVVIFESGERKLCFVVLDVTIITQEYTDRIRSGARRLGIDPDAVMVHATQTHSAPSVGHFMIDDEYASVPADREFVRGGDATYADMVVERVIEAIRHANDRLEAVEIGAGSAVREGLAFNRRGVMRDGKVCMPWFYSGLKTPLGPTHIRHLEGPDDPEVGLLCARAKDGRMVVMMPYFTCHPVNQYAKPGAFVTADWPGAWAKELQAIHGTGCVAMPLNGCCGNINPWPAFAPDFFPDHQRMGRALAETSEKIVPTLEFRDETRLAWHTRRISLPVREVDAAELKEAENYLMDHPDPPWLPNKPDQVDPKWNRAAWLWSIEMSRRRSTLFSYEIQVFRLGDAAFVSLPGEPFVEGQLALKIASPTYPTYVVHGTTQYVAYLPTRDAYPRGGHEVFFCKLMPGALETVVEEATGMLKELFR